MPAISCCPKKLAVTATAANKKLVEQERQAWLRKEAKLKSESEDLAKLMSDVTVTILQKVGEHDQLFGSVTSKDIAEHLERQNYTVDRRKILLPEPIKTLGDHKVNIRLHHEVNAEITVRVLSDAEPTEETEESPAE